MLVSGRKEMYMSDDSYDFEGECEAIHDTGLALLVRTSEHGEVWIPQSCIHGDSEVYNDGDKGRLVVVLWFAEKQGWV